MKINWKNKLSSRKFWAMLAALVISVMTLFGFGELTSEQVAVVITGIGALCVYMLSESSVDKARLSEENTDPDENMNDSDEGDI